MGENGWFHTLLGEHGGVAPTGIWLRGGWFFLDWDWGVLGLKRGECPFRLGWSFIEELAFVGGRAAVFVPFLGW